MHHPDLEKQLEDLKAQRQEATQALRDLATEAVNSNDKVNKTMMMYLNLSGGEGCACEGTYCTCTSPKQKKRTSRIFSKRKLRRKINGADKNGTNGTHP
jgi:hypothetical protein